MLSIKALLKIPFMRHLSRQKIQTIMTLLCGRLSRETGFWNKNCPILKINTQNKLKPLIKLYTLKNGKTDLIAKNQPVMLISI